MTCKDCIHYKVCKIIDMAGIWEKAELCECFKAADLVVELPCEVGDTVYEIRTDRGFIQEYTVISIHISTCGVLFGWEVKDGIGIYSNVNGFSDYAIGKSVFLTRAEAEKALEGTK